MDNDYVVKLGREAFGLLHDMVETEIRRRTSDRIEAVTTLRGEQLDFTELWVAIERADQNHQCVDEGHSLRA